MSTVNIIIEYMNHYLNKLDKSYFDIVKVKMNQLSTLIEQYKVFNYLETANRYIRIALTYIYNILLSLPIIGDKLNEFTKYIVEKYRFIFSNIDSFIPSYTNNDLLNDSFKDSLDDLMKINVPQVNVSQLNMPKLTITPPSKEELEQFMKILNVNMPQTNLSPNENEFANMQKMFVQLESLQNKLEDMKSNNKSTNNKSNNKSTNNKFNKKFK